MRFIDKPKGPEVDHESADGLFHFMNIRVFLSDVAGSSEQDIEEIERYLLSKQPFGLACSRSMIIFMPEKEKGYWLWSDHSPGPVFKANGWSEFVDIVKMQYLSHKKILSPDDILAVTSILDYERKKQRLADIRRGVLPQPGESARQMGSSDKGTQPGRIVGYAFPESSSGPADAILLPKSICDAEDIPGDECENGSPIGG